MRYQFLLIIVAGDSFRFEVYILGAIFRICCSFRRPVIRLDSLFSEEAKMISWIIAGGIFPIKSAVLLAIWVKFQIK